MTFPNRKVLTEKDIPTLPRQLRKYVEKCKKFKFIKTEKGVDFYIGDGLEIRYAKREALDNYSRTSKGT